MRSAGWSILVLAGMVSGVLAPAAACAEDGATVVAVEMAYNREINSRLQYLAFAKRADREGLRPIAALFRAVARAESIHAVNHEIVLAQLGGRPDASPVPFVVRSTAENLLESIDNERVERLHVYPLFADYARAECKYEALASLNYAGGAEETHARLFAAAYASLELSAGPPAPLVAVATTPGEAQYTLDWLENPPTFYVCPGDGSVFTHAVKRCPNCGTSGSCFQKFTGPPAVPPALTSLSAPVTLTR
jgi:rubrerythrin